MRITAWPILCLIGLSLSSAVAGENLPNLQTGYQDGFYVRTSDERFGLKLGTRFNFGYTYGFVSPAPDFSSFDLYHAKIYAGGNAFGQTVQFYFQTGAATNSRGFATGPFSESPDGGFTIEDYFVRLYWNDTNVRLGQYKVPFGRQWIIYSGNLQFVDRSIATKAFTLGRDRGITINGNRPTFTYILGVFNGGGNPTTGSGLLPFGTTGHNVSNDTAGGGKGHLYLVRLTARPFGSVGFSEGDVESREGHGFELGAGFVFDHGRDVDLNGDGVVDDTDADVWSIGTDVVWKSQGKSVQGEFFYRKLNGSITADLTSMGFYVQPAIFVLPRQLEIALLFSWLDADLDSPNDRVWEGAVSTNLYLFSDHRYKTQLQYSWRAQESPLGGRNDDSFIDLLFQLTI